VVTSVATTIHVTDITQEGEDAETAEDMAMINDGDPFDNHSQGDAHIEGLGEFIDSLGMDPPNLYTPGKCMNVLGTNEEGEEEICGDACNPAEQMCHWCRTQSHRITGMF
jgi:hypothetical protein